MFAERLRLVLPPSRFSDTDVTSASLQTTAEGLLFLARHFFFFFATGGGRGVGGCHRWHLQNVVQLSNEDNSMWYNAVSIIYKAPSFTFLWNMWTLWVPHSTSDTQCGNCRPLVSTPVFLPEVAQSLTQSVSNVTFPLPPFRPLFFSPPRNENGSCLIKLVLISERLKPLQLAGEQRTWRRNYIKK